MPSPSIPEDEVKLEYIAQELWVKACGKEDHPAFWWMFATRAPEVREKYLAQAREIIASRCPSIPEPVVGEDGMTDEERKEDMANVGTAFMEKIESYAEGLNTHGIGTSWCNCPTELFGDLLEKLDESVASYRKLQRQLAVVTQMHKQKDTAFYAATACLGQEQSKSAKLQTELEEARLKLHSVTVDLKSAVRCDGDMRGVMRRILRDLTTPANPTKEER